jgi:hypothetical protein
MNRIKNHLIAAAVLSVLALIGTIMNSHQAAAQGPPNGLAVNIVNPVPVPVSGNVGITGNSAANPLIVEDRIEPVSFFTSCNTSGDSCTGNPYTVPPGKLLIIEYLSAGVAQLPAGEGIQVIIFDATPGTHDQFFHMNFPTGVGSKATVGQLTRLYFSPGKLVEFLAARAVFNTTTSVLVNFEFSGRLVPFP